MTDRDALLRSILESPAEDLPRLVFADWCDENGEPERAAFIRVQCELAKSLCIVCRGCGKAIIVDDRVCDGCVCNSPAGINHGLVPEHVCVCKACDPDLTGSVREGPLRRRERELWDAMYRGIEPGFEWDYPADGKYDQTKRGSPHLTDMRRGFVSSITLSWQDWLAHHERLFWSPRQTVECRCRLHNPASMQRKLCRCKDGRIPRPFVATAQPLEEVRFTTDPTNIRNENEWWIGEYRFNRVKCPKCVGTGTTNMDMDCPCGGDPVNEWECDRWPGLRFVIP